MDSGESTNHKIIVTLWLVLHVDATRTRMIMWSNLIDNKSMVILNLRKQLVAIAMSNECTLNCWIGQIISGNPTGLRTKSVVSTLVNRSKHYHI